MTEARRAGGPAAATVDAIAKRAAVSRTTIYKWWPSSAAIVLDGLLDSPAILVVLPLLSAATFAASSWLATVQVDLDD